MKVTWIDSRERVGGSKCVFGIDDICESSLTCSHFFLTLMCSRHIIAPISKANKSLIIWRSFYFSIFSYPAYLNFNIKRKRKKSLLSPCPILTKHTNPTRPSRHTHIKSKFLKLVLLSLNRAEKRSNSFHYLHLNFGNCDQLIRF